MGILAQGFFTLPGEGSVHHGQAAARSVAHAPCAPVPDHRPCGADAEEPDPEDLPHEALRQEQGARQEQVLVLHEEDGEGQEDGCEILAVNEIFEKNPNTVKNYAIWLRYRSRTDQHNMYKEYRDMTINGAVSQMYHEMAGRHRGQAESITIMKTAIIPAEKVRRDHVKQMLNSKLKYPVVRKLLMPEKKLRETFVAKRPITFVK